MVLVDWDCKVCVFEIQFHHPVPLLDTWAVIETSAICTGAIWIKIIQTSISTVVGIMKV